MKKAFVLALLVAAIPIVAQPVFTADDLPDIGYEATLVQDTAEVIIVDVGSTGGPQTWDFSREVTGLEVGFDVLDPDDTPAVDSFPGAEFVYHINGRLQDTISGEAWQYYQTTSNEMLLIGEYLVSDTFVICRDYDPDRINSVLPFQMGAEWDDSFYTADTISHELNIIIEQWGKSHSKVDAWGTAIVPADTFDEALRYITYDTTITLLTFFVPGDTDIVTTINYTWIAADAGAITRISSLEDEIDPQFDTAGTYVVLTENNLTPGIEETKMTAPPEIRIRDQRIFFNTAQAGVVELDLYDAGGRRAASLCHGILPTGEHSLPLPANLPRGVYFVRMRTSTESMTGKFVVLN